MKKTKKSEKTHIFNPEDSWAKSILDKDPPLSDLVRLTQELEAIKSSLDQIEYDRRASFDDVDRAAKLYQSIVREHAAKHELRDCRERDLKAKLANVQQMLKARV